MLLRESAALDAVGLDRRVEGDSHVRAAAGLLREIGAAWPGEGFHRRLVQLSLARLRTHPLNPLPMFKP